MFYLSGERLRNFYIGMMMSPPNEVQVLPYNYESIYYQTGSVGAGETKDIATDGTVSGRYLVIQLIGNIDTLTLCEVEVYGTLAGFLLVFSNYYLLQFVRIIQNDWHVSG